MGRLLPITSVQYIVNGANIDYLVVYNHEEYAFLRHSPQAGSQSQVVSFTSFGKEVPLNVSGAAVTSSREAVLGYLG